MEGMSAAESVHFAEKFDFDFLERGALDAAEAETKYVLFDQYGNDGVMLAPGFPSFCASYEASQVLASRGFSGSAGEMIETLYNSTAGRPSDEMELQAFKDSMVETFVELQKSTRRQAQDAAKVISVAPGDGEDHQASTWHENSADIEALHDDDDDDDGSVTSGITNVGEAFHSPSFWDDSLLSIPNSRRRSNSDSMKWKIRSRLKALRSIVPGGDKLDTMLLLEEVIRYIRSLQGVVEESSRNRTSL